MRAGPAVELGLRANAGQFALLVGVSALVGGMVGQERAVVPLLAVDQFGLTTASATLAFLVAFGLTKAVTNLVAGALADRVGRKPVLVAGWVVGLPVPFLLIAAPAWSWVVFANILLGVNQGLTWSTTVLMKIDLVGPRRRGLALGLNEASGYLAVAVTAFLTGLIAESAGLRPAPFFLGIAIVGLGLGASVLFVQWRRAATPSPRGLERRGEPAREILAPARLAQHGRGPLTLGRVAGGSRQQPERRVGLGAAADRPGRSRPVDRRDRSPRRGIPSDLGVARDAGRDRGALRRQSGGSE